MVQSVEAIVVGEGDVCGMVQQQSQHVIPFLRDRIVQGCVAFRVLCEQENILPVMYIQLSIDESARKQDTLLRREQRTEILI